MSSTVIAKNVQIGADGTASNNFTIFQPATPDGTLRIGNGNTGITSSAVALTSAGNVGIGTSSPGRALDISRSTTAEIRMTKTSGTNQFLDIGTGGGTDNHYLYGYGNYPMIFATNSTERMRIDSSGCVTMPYQPAFIASSVAGTATYTGGAKVLFNVLQQQKGAGYNTANSRFTAPVSGYYLFKAQVWSYSSNPSATRFGVNGTSVWGSYGNEATQIGFNGYALVEIFYLAAGDYVEVFNRLGTTYTDGGYSLFSGTLLN